ncbi:protein VAC14 homolog isoform X3 [Folsomia candida]|uniref:protein VAC14 homolog isoform X3 n=1 Tax=Folsomia candida TaxID=158441 RepID=UPI000B8F7BA8|nr:protein VAC14 homolog isoform X3 [Folsomia candida]
MADKDYSPLSLACVKSLSDKSYEKRRQAAAEIEKMVKDFTQMKNSEQIKKLLRVLGHDFTMSQMTNWRKGGIIGLASSAMGLGRDAGNYIDELILPILHCFGDSDPRARYYACEGLYNVTKVARGAILLHFNEIFNALSKLAADPDQNVRSGTEMLDRLLKDIVTESASFDLVTFIPLLRERLYTKNTFARQFVISWISVLHAVPDINLVIFLPELLDGLFHILEDPTMEIKKMCETVLGEFLREIIKNPNYVDFSGMINILIAHSQSKDELLQLMAVTWIKEFVSLAGTDMVPYGSGILSAVLPCLAYEDDNRKNIRETGKAVNYSLMKLITNFNEQSVTSANKIETTQVKDNGDESTTAKTPSKPIAVDLTSLVDVLTRNLQNTAVSTKVAVLRWIYHLTLGLIKMAKMNANIDHLKMGDEMFRFVDETFPVLLKTLSDPSDEVVLLSLEVLAEIVSFPCKSREGGDDLPVKIEIQNNPYFIKFVVSLLGLFSTDRQLLEDRGAFIIRQLCVLLSSEAIYRTISEILLEEENFKFANVMVETLNTILLTSAELFELRMQLKELKTRESCSLFTSLYRTWAHDPVATVALCLLTQNYDHACDIIRTFGQIEVTVEFLVEIDKLVQLIESPIFTYLRLDLLDGHHNTELVQALYGLLMLLPQSEGFHVLQRRLNCVPSFHLPPGSKLHGEPKTEERVFVKEITFKELLVHFRTVQERHKRSKQANKTAELIEKGMKAMDF